MKSHTQNYDLIIIGGGIIGLAHAVLSIEYGLKTLLIERDRKAVGASIRNFGLIWPIGQPQGTKFDRAMKSRKRWVEMAKKCGFWCLENGSLHLAYNRQAMDVLEEYHRTFGYETQMLTPSEVSILSHAVNSQGLRGGLYSPTELNIDPKEAIYSITQWLDDHPKCTLRYGEKALEVESGYVKTSKSTFQADKIIICSGSDFQSLYPSVFRESGLIKSKLQMLRTKPMNSNFELGPTLCGELTLRHYASFAQCKSLDVYKKKVAQEMPEYDKWGIHVMISQNSHNELIIGDSHEYGFTFDPFIKQEINDLILRYMKKFASVGEINMLENWYGVYAKHPTETEFIAEPEEGVKIATGFGGAGMTFSFGYAEEEFA